MMQLTIQMLLVQKMTVMMMVRLVKLVREEKVEEVMVGVLLKTMLSHYRVMSLKATPRKYLVAVYTYIYSVNPIHGPFPTFQQFNRHVHL